MVQQDSSGSQLRSFISSPAYSFFYNSYPSLVSGELTMAGRFWCITLGFLLIAPKYDLKYVCSPHRKILFHHLVSSCGHKLFHCLLWLLLPSISFHDKSHLTLSTWCHFGQPAAPFTCVHTFEKFSTLEMCPNYTNVFNIQIRINAHICSKCKSYKLDPP